MLKRHAIEALTKIGMPRKLAPRLFGLLTAHVADVRDAARAAIASYGEEIVPAIRDRIPQALPDERRALEAILADLGGKDAFSTLLDGLASSEGEAAKQAAIAMRAHVKSAGARERRSYLSETEKFLAKQTKAGAAADVIAAAIKIMGYLEDEKATETLLAYASDKKQPPLVRQEALIALRFALGREKADEKKVYRRAARRSRGRGSNARPHRAAHVGVDGAPRGDGEAGREARGASRISSARGSCWRCSGARRTRGHARPRRTRRARSSESAPRSPRRRSAGARTPWRRSPRRSSRRRTPTARGCCGTCSARRRRRSRPLLRKQLLDEALSRLGDGARGWEALLDVVRDADADGVATALRALAQKLRKAKNDDKAAAVYRPRSAGATGRRTTIATPSPRSSSPAGRRTRARKRATRTSR